MTRPLNRHPEGLAVGQRVVTDFTMDEEDVVRRVTSIQRDDRCGSGWRISADAGEPCGCCKRPFGKPVPAVDGSWFVPVEESKGE